MCNFDVGDQYDVLDLSGRWSEAIVLCKEAANDSHNEKVQIKYRMWGKACVEWIEINSKRIANFGSRTYQGGPLCVGHEIAACRHGRWFDSEVVEANEDAVKVHYIGQAVQCDEWHLRASGSLRRTRTVNNTSCEMK
jgi:hypothetical protein